MRKIRNLHRHNGKRFQNYFSERKRNSIFPKTEQKCRHFGHLAALLRENLVVLKSSGSALVGIFAKKSTISTRRQQLNHGKLQMMLLATNA